MKTNRLTIVAVSGISLLMLGSCNIYQKYDVAKQDSELAQAYAQSLEQPEDTTAFGNLDWRTVFTDPVLQDLINQALENNIDLENARLNVELAQASLKGARLNYLPSVALAPNGSGGKYFDVSDWSWTYQLPLSVSWEVDIFGKLLNAKRGAEAQVLASREYEQAVHSQIIAAVANCYYSLATIEAQLELQRSTAKIWEQSVQIMRDFKEAGRVTEAAVVQSAAQYYSILASITDTETSLVDINNKLSLLLGVMPRQWSVSPNAVLEMPVDMRQSIPLRELASRPDVRAAEMKLAVAYYATNSARSAFYPGLNITANGGFTNLVGSMVMNPGKFFLNLAGSLTIPLFARGGLIAQLEATKVQQKQALNNFEYSLMNAAAEVSNAMTVYQNSLSKQQYLIEQTANLEKAVDYTMELMKMGTAYTTYLEVLTAQQNLLSAQMGELNCRLKASSAVINLYQSLGGGRI